PALPGDGVCLEAGPVIDVQDVHLLVLEDVGGIQQVRVDRDRAHVVQVAPRDRGAVVLGLEHHALHQARAFPGSGRRGFDAPSGASKTLSIRRTSPMRAASASSAAAASSSIGSSVSGSTSATYSGSTPSARMRATLV